MVNSAEPLLRDKPVWRRRLALLSRNDGFFKWMEIACAIILVAMVILSAIVILDRRSHQSLLPAVLAASLLLANLLPALALMVLLGRRVAKRRASKSESGSNGELHVRLVGMFSLLAAIPTLLMVIFASLLFQYGIEFWFSDRSRSMLENANELARGYYAQSQEDVGNQTRALAKDLRGYLTQTTIDSAEFAEGYSYQVLVRSLSESAIIELGQNGEIKTPAIAKLDGASSLSNITPAMIRELGPSRDVLVSVNSDRVEAIAVIDQAAGIYLYTARKSDLLAFSQGEKAQEVLDDYDQLSAQTNNLQFRFNIALFFVSLFIVGFALWAALRLADRMVRPLDDLAVAANKISTGNFSPRVTATVRRDEIGMLGRSFNRMAQRLEKQTQALVSANDQLDNRRAFIEAILESATAGIISVDDDGRIRLMNSSANRLLFRNGEDAFLGKHLRDVAPPLAKLVDAGESDRVIQYATGSKLLTLAIKIVREPIGHVITFEDITQQLLDQRQAAWSDVAQRIAHEIKNPLTPIQLATERLKRRYAKEVVSDPEIFGQLTDTIIRQVGDLRNMVDEFSSFAKMPKPVFREENFYELVRQSVFMHDVAHARVDFDIDSDIQDVPVYCDRRQIAQALTNILKNAVESIETRAKSENADFRGKVRTRLQARAGELVVSVSDNGIGLPDNRDRIIEPYVTTREKGTGLGLAIVKKIIEEHFGAIDFANEAPHGACVTIRFDTRLLRNVGIGTAGDKFVQPDVKLQEKLSGAGATPS